MKVIELLNKIAIGRNKDEKLIKDYYLSAQCSKVLLDILQGEGKE